jgi:hypothetical protein
VAYLVRLVISGYGASARNVIGGAAHCSLDTCGHDVDERSVVAHFVLVLFGVTIAVNLGLFRLVRGSFRLRLLHHLFFYKNIFRGVSALEGGRVQRCQGKVRNLCNVSKGLELLTNRYFLAVLDVRGWQVGRMTAQRGLGSRK